MSTISGVAVIKSAQEGFHRWIADSGSTKYMTPYVTAFTEYNPAAPRGMVEVADKTLLPVQGYSGLTLELQQPDGIKNNVTLQNVAHVPALGRNLLSTRRAREKFDQLPEQGTACSREEHHLRLPSRGIWLVRDEGVTLKQHWK